MQNQYGFTPPPPPQFLEPFEANSEWASSQPTPFHPPRYVQQPMGQLNHQQVPGGFPGALQEWQGSSVPLRTQQQSHSPASFIVESHLLSNNIQEQQQHMGQQHLQGQQNQGPNLVTHTHGPPQHTQAPLTQSQAPRILGPQGNQNNQGQYVQASQSHLQPQNQGEQLPEHAQGHIRHQVPPHIYPERRTQLNDNQPPPPPAPPPPAPPPPAPPPPAQPQQLQSPLQQQLQLQGPRTPTPSQARAQQASSPPITLNFTHYEVTLESMALQIVAVQQYVEKLDRRVEANCERMDEILDQLKQLYHSASPDS